LNRAVLPAIPHHLAARPPQTSGNSHAHGQTHVAVPAGPAADAQSLAVGRDHNLLEPVHVLSALIDQQGGSVRPC
jgi:hypothetical protein